MNLLILNYLKLMATVWIRTYCFKYIRFSDIVKFEIVQFYQEIKNIVIYYILGNEISTIVLENSVTEEEGKVIIEDILSGNSNKYIVTSKN